MTSGVSVARPVAWLAAGAIALALLAISAEAASAARLTVLYSFCAQTNCTDGAVPGGGLAFDQAGNLYGTTSQGGNVYSYDAAGFGTVFELVPNSDQSAWSLQQLYAFCPNTARDCPDGRAPTGSLVLDTEGSLYGVTQSGGGVNKHTSTENGGTAYELTPNADRSSWRLTRLHVFCDYWCTKNGGPPNGTLTYAGASTGVPYDGVSPLYGTTSGGGLAAEYGGGTAFALAPDGTGKWSQTIVYNFCWLSGCRDGYEPAAGVITDGSGNLYGTVQKGGGGDGGIFELQPSAGIQWTEALRYAFVCKNGCNKGTEPQSRLVMDAAGNLYVTTSQYGRFCQDYQCGTVFELVAATGKLKVLHSFCDGFDCRDGKLPDAGLTMDASGNLYGATTEGGGNDLQDQNGAGVLYKIDPAGRFSVLYRFCAKKNCADGDGPVGEVAVDGAGRLYGTTRAGGAHNSGVVFQLSPRN
jgi:uncharacterized repeat protein (TIGR03803 family)